MVVHGMGSSCADVDWDHLTCLLIITTSRVYTDEKRTKTRE